MIIYKPTGQIFETRKQAKKYFGTTFYSKLERDKTDIIFTNNIQLATNELYNTYKTNI
jgi:hypothetical protein